MPSDAGVSDELELVGTIRFNEFEGGFWSLELDSAIDDLGDHVVLAGWTPPAELPDGSRARVRARRHPETIDFLMAGPRVDVLDAAPA